MSAPQAGARTYITEIWCPPADNGVHALHSHMPEPEPLPEPEPPGGRDMTAPEPQVRPETAREYVAELAADAERARLAREAEADLGHDYDGPELRSGTPEYEAEYAEYQAWVAQPESGHQPVPYTLTPEAEAVLDAASEAEVCGPRLPELHDLCRAQDAPCEANRAGCSDAVYDRLVLERQQTEAAYLAGYDRELDRALEAEAAEAEPEAEL